MAAVAAANAAILGATSRRYAALHDPENPEHRTWIQRLSHDLTEPEPTDPADSTPR